MATILRGKEITLKSLESHEIEKIRQIRNSEEIRKYFIFRKNITKHEQSEWFNKISKSKNDFYFSIYFGDILIGLTEIKKVNWKLKTGEGGIFIVPEYQNSFNSFEASLLVLDYAFEELKLQKMYAKVLRSNKRALNYNKFFGFKEYNSYMAKIENVENEIVLLCLTPSDYQSSKQKIVSIINQ